MEAARAKASLASSVLAMSFVHRRQALMAIPRLSNSILCSIETIVYFGIRYRSHRLRYAFRYFDDDSVIPVRCSMNRIFVQ